MICYLLSSEVGDRLLVLIASDLMWLIVVLSAVSRGCAL